MAFSDDKQIIIYQPNNTKKSVEVRVEKDTIWLTQKQIAELFGIERSVITKHIKNVIKTAELRENSVCAKFAHCKFR
ncbi:MAG: hypothetical protein AAB408_01535 [Patescibacteria group bacterium]